MYRITFIRSAEKEIEKLPSKIVRKISPVIDDLANDPRPRGSKKLKGRDEILWRVRIGDYRVIYLIEDVIKIIEVRKVGHRKDIYQ